jgi:XTP/dITP diphosphohydrolase
MNILLATKNTGKIIEFREALSDLPLKFLTPADIPGFPKEIPEEENSFHENALAKARFAYDHAQCPVLADDSGIIVEALQKELGVHTRRWGAGPGASDEEWIAHFLHRMKKERNKQAEFVCVLVLIDEAGKHLFEGHCKGTITETLEADYLPGLPISACFRPEGYDRVFSALIIEEKNKVSHRGRAMAKLREFLTTQPTTS